MKAASARVLLTGATGGIGRAAARQLALAGASLMLVGRSPARVSALARELAQSSQRSIEHFTWNVADLNDAAALGSLAQSAAAWGANVVVHNAGLPSFGALGSVSGPAMQQVLQTNLLAPMLLTQALLPHLQSLPKSQVVCVGSALGRLGLPGFSVYSASKFGLRGFAEALRRELASGPVKVQYFAPRSTRTEFNDDDVHAYNRATGTATDQPEQVAHALVQLLESEAAEAFLGFPEKLAVRLNGLVPEWLDGSFKKHRDSLPPAHAAMATRQSAPLTHLSSDRSPT